MNRVKVEQHQEERHRHRRRPITEATVVDSPPPPPPRQHHRPREYDGENAVHQDHHRRVHIDVHVQMTGIATETEIAIE